MRGTGIRSRAQRGVTLLELMLAVSILSLIIGTSGYILRVAFTSMDKIQEKVDLDRRVYGSQRALDQMLKGIVAINAGCAGNPIAFQGSAAAMRFVTAYSLTEGTRGRLQIAELIAETKSDGSGMRLVVNEYPYLGRASLAAVCMQPPSVRATSFILADQLAQCSFAFKREEPGSGLETWIASWSFPEWPRGVRIDMSPRNPAANGVQAATVSVPILVRNKEFEIN